LSTTSDSSPTFTAIVPTFNDTSVIGEALATLASQTEPFHEILVVDDGSTDGPAGDLASIVAATPGARLIRLPANRGVVAALNVGLGAATGDFVMLGSANDRYDARLVEHCRRLLASHPTLGAVTGNGNLWNETTRTTTPGLRPVSAAAAAFTPEDLARACRRSPQFVAAGYVIRRDQAAALGGLDPALRWHSDWFLFAAIAFTSGYGFVPETLATMTIGAGPRYSDGARDWRQERVVLRSLVARLNDLPAAADGFRRGAVLPRYDLRAIWLLRERDLRWILTPLLVWRMLVHSASYRLKDRVPRRLVLRLRAWVRS
jgi:glycosyltransferase involved in cell wall biosynthesis